MTLRRKGEVAYYPSRHEAARRVRREKGECVLDDSVKVEETLLSSYCRLARLTEDLTGLT